jgi:hypothetical protein
MLNFKRKYKAGEFGFMDFDNEAGGGLHGTLVRVDFDGTATYYSLDIAGDVPTDAERIEIAKEVESMFDDYFCNCDSEREIEAPPNSAFKSGASLYRFSIS